jgi:hypothetical protein
VQVMPIRGTLDKILSNESDLYEGNLVKYFQIIFIKAKNLRNPYHNFRHTMHVTWLCHDACTYYKQMLTQREMRNLLIAAMFHDFDHSGTTGEDSLNINLAVKAIKKYVLPEDRHYLEEIIAIIRATEYPYKNNSTHLNLCSQVIRDADLSQSLCCTWLQQVIFGLSAEWNKSPLEVLKIQTDYHSNLRFYTEWARTIWPKEEIDKKIEEITNLLEILEAQVP